MVSYHRTCRSRSALAYGSRSTATAETTSTGSYTTSGDATPTFVPQALFIGFFSYYHLVLLLLPEQHHQELLNVWTQHHGAFTT